MLLLSVNFHNFFVLSAVSIFNDLTLVLISDPHPALPYTPKYLTPLLAYTHYTGPDHDRDRFQDGHNRKNW